MEKILNKKKKRIGDLSEDKRVVEIVRDGCLTRISANKDGTLRIVNSFIDSSGILKER